MKIEKVNSNQIKCFLNKGDLLSREIKVSELAYGTEKAQELFKDMMEKASNEFGFEVDNVPLMIEAVPLSTDSIMLIITKVENPEELEDKFATLPTTETRKFKRKESTPKEPLSIPGEVEDVHNLNNSFFVYKFKNFEDLSQIAAHLFAYPIESSSLYRASGDNKFYLTMTVPSIERKAAKILRGVLSEFGDPVPARQSILSFYNEHFEIIIKENALRVLTTI